MADISKITPLGSSTTYNLKDNNAPRKDGTGASGTWGINISGSAALNVLKAGDTMTGNLTVSTNNNPNISLKNTDIDLTRATLPSATEYSSLYFIDKSGYLGAYLQHSQTTAGLSTFSFGARNRNSDNTDNISNIITLGVKADGTRTVSVTTPATWRSALGAVNIAGDTMTGNLISTRANHTADVGFVAQNTDTTNPLKIGYIIGTSGNGGIYDYTHSAWKLQIAPNGTATLNGNATKDGDGNTISSTYVKIGGSVMTGRLGFKISLAKGATPSASTGQTIQFYDNAGTANANRLGLIYNYVDTSGQSLMNIYAYDNVASSTNATYFGIYKSTADVRRTTTNAKIYGAVWNDYAEYRKDNLQEKELQKPGRCVKEIGNGALTLTTKRLERGCEIISDTFGFAIGEDPENGYNTPVASSGRVLAYPYESIEEFAAHIGWSVCSGPDGTISIMTEEEEEKYPGRIIGTISEIPDYEEWGQDKIKVNNRIWIRIR